MSRNNAATQPLDRTLQETMQAADAQEAKQNAQTMGSVIPGPGHYQSHEPMKQDVKAEKVALAKQIHAKNQALPSTELASQTSKFEAENQRLISRIAAYEAGGEAEVAAAEDEYKLYRAMLDAEMADAVKRRDAFIQTLNEEIAGIRLRLSAAESDHEMKKGQIIRHHQDQIASMQETIKRNKLWLEG